MADVILAEAQAQREALKLKNKLAKQKQRNREKEERLVLESTQAIQQEERLRIDGSAKLQYEVHTRQIWDHLERQKLLRMELTNPNPPTGADDLLEDGTSYTQWVADQIDIYLRRHVSAQYAWESMNEPTTPDDCIEKLIKKARNYQSVEDVQAVFSRPSKRGNS